MNLSVDPGLLLVIRSKGFLNKTQSLVAIVDDDLSVRRALKRLVLSLDMLAETFSSGAQFLDYLQATPLHDTSCVILDIQMPGLSGLEVLERLRELHWSLPVIVITAHETPSTYESALAAGAVAFLRKPFDEEALIRAIEAAIERQSPLRIGKS